MSDHRAAPLSPNVLIPHPGPGRVAIALDNRDLCSLRRHDLIDMIRASRMTADDVDELADSELQRLAVLVRRCCRNQMDAFRRQRGQLLLWAEAI